MSSIDNTPDKNSKNKNSKLNPVKKPIVNLSKLANVRIIQKHLVYVIGLSSNISIEKVILISIINIHILNLFQAKFQSFNNQFTNKISYKFHFIPITYQFLTKNFFLILKYLL